MKEYVMSEHEKEDIKQYELFHKLMAEGKEEEAELGWSKHLRYNCNLFSDIKPCDICGRCFEECTDE